MPGQDVGDALALAQRGVQRQTKAVDGIQRIGTRDDRAATHARKRWRDIDAAAFLIEQHRHLEAEQGSNRILQSIKNFWL